MPGAVALFAAYLGKATHLIVEWWRRGMQGKGDYSNLTGHFLILGWHGDNTKRMVELITADATRTGRDIILCTDDEMENPIPNIVSFVQGRSLSDESLLCRAGVKTASRIIIYGRRTVGLEASTDASNYAPRSLTRLKPKSILFSVWQPPKR